MADAVHTPRPLNQTDDRPRQVVAHHDGAVLEILPFAEHVGSHQHPQPLVGLDAVLSPVAPWAEAPGQTRGIRRFAGDGRHRRHPARPKLSVQIAHRVGELGEDEDFPVRMPVEEQRLQRPELGVRRRPPLAESDQETAEGRGVGGQVPAERFVEVMGGEPAKPTPVGVPEDRVDFAGTPAKVLLGPERRVLCRLGLLRVRVEQVGDSGVAVLV